MMSSSKSDPRAGRAVIEPDGSVGGGAELISPRFLIKGVIATVIAAVVLGYLTLCLLFYQGQWQVLLHPAAMQQFPAGSLPAHEDVHFAVTESGQATLFGWWIPADADSAMSGDVLVYFPGGSGSLSGRLQNLNNWHQQRINVFAFDYRGFGNSSGLHPNEQTLKADAVAVSRYLTETRHIPASHLVFFGEDVGCVTALHAARETPGVAALILADPRISQMSVYDADPRTHLLPLHLLLKDDYDIGEQLKQLQVPILVISTVGTQQANADAKRVFQAIGGARKTYIEAPPAGGLSRLTKQIYGFLESVTTQSSSESGAASVQPPGK